MKINELKNAVLTLAQSQGIYGRLYRDVEQNDEFWQHLEDQNFSDVVDMILFLEG